MALKPVTDAVSDEDLEFISEADAKARAQPVWEYVRNPSQAPSAHTRVAHGAQEESSYEAQAPEEDAPKPAVRLESAEPLDASPDSDRVAVPTDEALDDEEQLDPEQITLDLVDPDECEFIDPVEELTRQELSGAEDVEIGDQSDLVGESTEVLDIDSGLLGAESDLDEVAADRGADPFDSYIVDIEEVLRERVDRQPEALPQGVTREQRARQIAVQFIERWGWQRRHVNLMTEFFFIYGWSAARVALEREALYGLDPDELVVVMHLREVWSASDRYWIAFRGGETGVAAYRVLSWRMAVLICRNFHGCPEPEEAEAFVEGELEKWYWNDALRRQFNAFIKYLYVRVAGGSQLLPPDCNEEFSNLADDSYDDASDTGLIDILGTHRRQLLASWGFRLREGRHENLASRHVRGYYEWSEEILKAWHRWDGWLEAEPEPEEEETDE